MPEPEDERLPPDQWSVPPLDRRAGCRPSGYHPRFAEVICERIAHGETLKSICADPRMPSRATLHHWRRNQPDFEARYLEVRRHLARGRLQTVDWTRKGRLRIQQMKVEFAGRRWWRRGRGSSYSEDVGRRICARIERGAVLSRLVRSRNLPSSKVVYTWLRTEPAFRAMYVAACEARADWLAWNAEMVADTAEWHNLDRVKRKWARLHGRIGLLRPKLYCVAPGEM